MINLKFGFRSLKERCYGYHFVAESAKLAYLTIVQCDGIPKRIEGLEDNNIDVKRLNGDDPSTSGRIW